MPVSLGPSLGVASSVQVMLMALFEHWGAAGLEEHISSVQRKYRARCGTICRAATEHLAPTNLARCVRLHVSAVSYTHLTLPTILLV